MCNVYVETEQCGLFFKALSNIGRCVLMKYTDAYTHYSISGIVHRNNLQPKTKDKRNRSWTIKNICKRVIYIVLNVLNVRKLLSTVLTKTFRQNKIINQKLTKNHAKHVHVCCSFILTSLCIVSFTNLFFPFFINHKRIKL